MGEENHESRSAQIERLLAIALKSPWLEIAAETWKLAQKLWRGWADEGMYEVLDYEFTLELLDKKGERAVVRKRERVRYLQNSIMAYQDQAWGDGKILINYRCTPGVPVDQYRPGQKTYILISLREVKNRGDEDEFSIEWEAQNGFTRSTELWAAEVSHRTRRLKVEVIFPQSRPPVRTALVETTAQRVTALGQNALRQLADGRYTLAWETNRPRLYETYALRWDW